METAGVTKSPRFFLGVAVGQFISFIDSIGGTMVELAGSRSLPMFMAMGCYLLLACTHGAWHVKHHGLNLTLAWWKYMLLASIDIAAAYCTLSALRYTSVTSWALIQPFSLAVVVPLSILFLQARYNWRHLLSGLLAVAGLVLLLLSDVHSSDSEDKHAARTMLFGDFLTFLGASLYGVNTATIEMIVKGEVPQYELLGAMGAFGSVFSCVLAALLGEISTSMFPDWRIVVYTFGVIVVSFGFYALSVVVLENAGSAVFEISLLAVNFWSVLEKLFIVGGFQTNVVGFIFSLAMIVTGIASFALSGDPYAEKALSYTPLQTEMPSFNQEQSCKTTP